MAADYGAGVSVLESIFSLPGAAPPAADSASQDSLFFKPTLDDHDPRVPEIRVHRARGAPAPSARGCWYAAERPAGLQQAFGTSRVPGFQVSPLEPRRSRSPRSFAGSSGAGAYPLSPAGSQHAGNSQFSSLSGRARSVSLSPGAARRWVRRGGYPSPQAIAETGWLDPRRRSGALSLTAGAGREDTELRSSAARGLDLGVSPHRGAAEGEGREVRQDLYQAPRQGPTQGHFEGRCGTPLEDPGAFKALVDAFNDLLGRANSGDAVRAREEELEGEVTRLKEENCRLKQENDELQQSNCSLYSQVKTLREVIEEMEDPRAESVRAADNTAGRRRTRLLAEEEVGSAEDAEEGGREPGEDATGDAYTISTVVERRPNHELAPGRSILRTRTRRQEQPAVTVLRRRKSSDAAAKALARAVAVREPRVHITFDDNALDQQDPIESFRSADNSDLWYESYNVECNRCDRSLAWRNGADFSTIQGSAGRSRFAQWQVICKDCVCKDRFSEFGAMQLLRMSVLAGSNTNVLEGNMLRVLGIAAQIAPTEDVLMRVIRATQSSDLVLPGRAAHGSALGNELQIRSAVLHRAASLFRRQWDVDARRAAVAARKTKAAERAALRNHRVPGRAGLAVVRRRPAASAASAGAARVLRRPAAPPGKHQKTAAKLVRHPAAHLSRPRGRLALKRPAAKNVARKERGRS